MHSLENGQEIFKQLCLRCGGKGFYQNNIVVDSLLISSEVVSCLECEGGFIYGPKQTK